MGVCDDITRGGLLAPDEPDALLQAVLGDDPCEIAPVRTAVAALALRAGFADRAADAVLAFDEILANAQEHGRPPVSVRGWGDGRLVIVVSDHGLGFNRPAVWRTHPPDRFGRRGRGLWIARQLTDCMFIETGRAGTTVRLELSPDPHIGA